MHKTARRVLRQALLLTLASSTCLVPAVAFAAKKDRSAKQAKKTNKTKVVLAAFTGPKSGDARGWAKTGLEKDDSIDLISNDKAASVARGSSDSDYASVAASFGAAALVIGRVNLQKKVGWSVTLWVHNGADGKLLKKLTVRGGLLPGLRKKLEKSIGEILAPTLAKAEKGAEAADTSDETDTQLEGAEDVTLEEEPADEAPGAGDESADADASASPGELGPSPVDLRVGLRLYQRSFAFTDTLSDYDAAYQPLLVHETAAGSPMFIFSGNVYPLSFLTKGLLANIGVTVGYEEGFLTKTSLPDPCDPNVQARDRNQSHRDAYLGIRYRLLMGAHEIAPYVSFGKHSFSIDDDKYPYEIVRGAGCFVNGQPNVTYQDALPDVGYSYVDLGLEPRFVFGAISLGGHAAYRFVNDTGGLQQISSTGNPYDTWFPNAAGYGVSAGVFGGYAVTDMFEILVGADFTRYGFDFNHIPTAAERSSAGQPAIPPERIAGGATDTYISGWVALGVRFPGAPGTGGADVPDNVVEDPENEDVEELDF